MYTRYMDNQILRRGGMEPVAATMSVAGSPEVAEPAKEKRIPIRTEFPETWIYQTLLQRFHFVFSPKLFEFLIYSNFF